MRTPPPESAALLDRVLFVVNDFDPGRLTRRGTSPHTYQPLAADLAALFVSGAPVTPDTVAETLRGHPELAEWMLDAGHGWSLRRFSASLARLRDR